jgi:hypothetical protein
MNKKMFLVVAVLIAATGCGSTTSSEEPSAAAPATSSEEPSAEVPATQSVSEYFDAESAFDDDLSEVVADMTAVSAAAQTGSAAVVQIACENLLESASSALAKYSDAPVQAMLDGFQNLVDSAATCMAGDNTASNTYVNQATDNFIAAKAQMDAAG